MDQIEPKFGKSLIRRISKMITELKNFMEKMPSTTIARILLFTLFLQLILCGAMFIITLYSSLRFVAYRKILPNFMQRYGLFSGVFIITIYTTLITIIAPFQVHKFCFVEATRFSKNFSDLKLLKYELLTCSIATLACGCILFIFCGSWQKPIRDNVLYAIKHAISDNDYAQDINIIQQNFECCGVSVQGAEPNHIWLYYLLPDIAFQENLYDKMHSLPWSCCRSDYQFMFCDQFAYERFIVPFNETYFSRLPSYAVRFKKNWGCVSLSDCKQKREIALNSVYKQDCAQAFYQAFKTGFFYLNGAMLIILGLYIICQWAMTNHLETVLLRTNYFKTPPSLL